MHPSLGIDKSLLQQRECKNMTCDSLMSTAGAIKGELQFSDEHPRTFLYSHMGMNNSFPKQEGFTITTSLTL